MAAGGATDTRCGGRGGEGGGLQQITAHSNSYPYFSLSFCPLCIRRGFDKNSARSSAEQILKFFDADADPGSGIFFTLVPGRKNSDPGYVINIQDLQHCFLVFLFSYYSHSFLFYMLCQKI
jgi:hypothetical protein